MPTQSATSAREILTGLHDVMASKHGAQAKLNKVVKSRPSRNLYQSDPIAKTVVGA